MQIEYYEKVIARVEDLVEDTNYGGPLIVDTILSEDEIIGEAAYVLLKMGLQALAEGKIKQKRDRGTLRREEDEELVQTVIETDETGNTVERQVRRIPNITENHRTMMFRGLAKEYINAVGERVAILQFTAADVAVKLAALRPQKEGLDLKVAAFEATDAALRKYSAEKVSDLSNKVKTNLDALWLEVRE